MKPAGVLFLALMCSLSSAWAQEEGSASQTWTSASGAKIEASLDSIRGDVVVLNKAGGGQVKIRMNQLSSADQIFARSQSSAIPAAVPKIEETAAIPPEIEALFGDKLIDAKKKRVSPASLSGKKIGIYFSAHWCPPCRAFTPELVKFYNQLKTDNKPFEIVFVSSDQDEQGMMNYMKEMDMPWLALRFGDKRIPKLKEQFGVSGIPTLVIVDDKGKTVSNKARGEVMTLGAAAFDAW
ncbi:MAG: thioredoxin-like domain-containing protein [Kiritimatiellia bacterium]